MSAADPIPEGETGFDRVLAFTIPDRNARGRVVRLGPALDDVLSAHDYPTAIRHLLAEAMVLTALVGSLLKDSDGQVTMQAHSEDGIVNLLVCDYLSGAIRGYVRHDPDRLAALGTFPSLPKLFGSGYLAITFDFTATDTRYQGIVPLEGDTLSDICQTYFAQSEQLPTLIRTAIRWDGQRCVAGGILVQHLAESEEGGSRLHARMDHPEWEHVAALAGSTRKDELVDSSLSLEALVWRLFHEEREVRVETGARLSRGCRCSSDYYQSVLSRFPEEERAEMRGNDGFVSVDCAFCSRTFKIGV